MASSSKSDPVGHRREGARSTPPLLSIQTAGTAALGLGEHVAARFKARGPFSANKLSPTLDAGHSNSLDSLASPSESASPVASALDDATRQPRQPRQSSSMRMGKTKSKSKSRLDRFSSFFPSLISSQPADTSTSAATGPSDHRKPITTPLPPPPVPPVPPVPDRAPTLPPGAAADSAGLGTTFDTPTDSQFAADVQKVHTRNSSSISVSGASMGRLRKAAPAQQAPPLPPKIMTPPPPSEIHLPDSKPSPRLRKEQPKRRSSSFNSHAPSATYAIHTSHTRSQSGLMPQQGSPPLEPRGRSSSAQPPGGPGPAPGNRMVSAAAAAVPRPSSSNESHSPTRDSQTRGRLRRSWLPGGRSRSQSRTRESTNTKHASPAWILGQDVDYNTTLLANGEKVPELWSEMGDILVYLDPKGSGGGPSFKVPSFVIDYSLVFADLIEAEVSGSPTSSGHTLSFPGRDNLSAMDAMSPPLSPPIPESRSAVETPLYIPVSMSTPEHRSEADLDRMISIRNLFAFLTGQPLVATKAQPTLFTVVINIAALLKEFEFTNHDGSTFGDAVEMSFSFFMEQMALADVRHSREKTLESLIMGERMRSMELYNEAFAHAVGKYSAMRDLKSPLWEQVLPSTRLRLERAHFDLVGRQASVNNRLESFDFPAIFSGVANSTSLTEYKDVKFGTWRKSYGRMRHFVLNYYKANFGSWPPKARSKKNPFTESGLNRQVLKILYSDLCALYDLLVDRKNLTTRAIDKDANDIGTDHTNPHASAMRRVLTEFDQSSPPVLPPIPFDLPMLPDMTSVKENYHALPAKEQARLAKGLQEYQMLLILNKAYDFETYKLRIPFLEEFKDFENKEAKGKTAAEMAEQRLGYWLFLYVVIQSLPILVVDAPGLKFTEGVEYFLCQPPKGSPPWIEDAPAVRKRWYEVAGGGGLVELSTDAVEFSVEGVYHRSHCWMAAKRWEMGEDAPPPAPHESLSPLQAPQSVFTDMDPSISPSPTLMGRSASPSSIPPGGALRPRTDSPGGRQSMYRSSIAFGLEPVPMMPERPHSRVYSARGVSPGQRRPSSAMMGRSRSSGNLHGMAVASPVQGQAPDSRASSRQDSLQGGSTFDDILKGVEKPKKKKGLF
ncbi:Uu.00g015160.m01.CDS01 [Anthostomella pinea]|uniref:Uu.00g015160.m01.CDS01 n=1 Tax=Anthostomella pinea TaxID=933095 RepID=A0AAI8YN58_9PEZI|nr:Uu.00g015160.m01.CDS01 [Anthostomella pinea]